MKIFPIDPSDKDIQRFHESYMPEPNSGCWLWMGYYGHWGYGSFYMQGKQYRAHRVSYAVHKGKIPDGLYLDHLCRTPACVNPDHLEPVTKRDNILRGISPAAHHAAQDKCKRGHMFNQENTTFIQNGKYRKRVCRICDRDRQRERYHRKLDATRSSDGETR